MADEKTIHIRGARVHNLKSLDVVIPRERLVVITGVSGSGKSSLAFDTLFAEGYRKFMDSLSTRARALLEQVPRPEVDYVEGLTPVVAIEQRTTSGANPRSTVATITEVADYARLLWALCGVAHCPEDGGRIVQRSLDDCIAELAPYATGSRMLLLAPLLRAKTSVLRGELPHLRQKGYQRVRIDGEVVELDDPGILDGRKGELQLDIVIDRMVWRADQRSRVADSLELAFREGADRAIVLLQQPGEEEWHEVPLGRNFSCRECGRSYPALTQRLFSWDHPDGACPCCGGLGETMQFSAELLVPDPQKTLRQGAIKPWRIGTKRMIIERNALLKQLAEQYPFDPNVPWETLPEAVRRDIIYGTGERLFHFKLRPGKRTPEPQPFGGVLADLQARQQATRSDGYRHRMVPFQHRMQCPECGGRRLGPLARGVLLEGVGYADFLSMSLEQARAFVAGLRLEGFAEAIAGLRHRIEFLCKVGLGYLSLDRPYSTLSGGESQRVRLATQVGMGLAGVTYVLDEPTIGLHPANTRDLLQSIAELRERGNGVIVVEHDADVMRCADHLIEIGPGAGEAGGRLVFAGTLEEAMADRRCLSGAYLSGRRKIEKPAADKQPGGDWVVVRGAVEHNLRDLEVAFPCGLLTVVTGVSGSGKSTLVNDILGKAAAFKLNGAKEIPGRHGGIDGLQHFDRVIRVDQQPIGRSPRSNPATFTKVFDELRKLYAQVPLAKVRGYGPGRFSFNVRGGRCERCQGDGVIRMDMQFMGDVYQECPSCAGQRYNRETLEVRFKGLNVADALQLTVDQAVDAFAKQPRLISKLETLQAVGLGYLRLGQAAPTLSGGEAQRLKLSLELSKGKYSHNLYLLDEPTTGLHWTDIELLLGLLFKLRDQGHTLILIEHHVDTIRLADWVIDLGPGGGSDGGQLLFAGPPKALPTASRSVTKDYL